MTSPDGPFPLRREDDVLSADDAASQLDGQVAGSAEMAFCRYGGGSSTRRALPRWGSSALSAMYASTRASAPP